MLSIVVLASLSLSSSICLAQSHDPCSHAIGGYRELCLEGDDARESGASIGPNSSPTSLSAPGNESENQSKYQKQLEEGDLAAACKTLQDANDIDMNFKLQEAASTLRGAGAYNRSGRTSGSDVDLENCVKKILAQSAPSDPNKSPRNFKTVGLNEDQKAGDFRPVQ